MKSFAAVSRLVRFGLVGLHWGDRVAQAARRIPGVAIVGGFARTAEARDEFARRHGCETYASFESMLRDSRLEGIIVMTPNATHRELAIAAMEAGKHVLVTKPIAASLDDASAMIVTARERGRVLAVGHQARRHAGVRAMKAMLDGGALGEPVMIEANTSSPAGSTYANSWRSSAAECPGGPLLQLGIHAIDNFQYLLGPVEEVSSYQARAAAGDAPPAVTQTLCRFPEDVSGSLAASYMTPWTRWLRLSGTDAVACYDGANGVVVNRPGKAPEAVVPAMPNEEIVIQAVADELADFARCIRDGTTPEIDGEVGARNLAVVLAAVEAQRRASIVGVAELWSGAARLA